jgi:hypothetical protein
LRVVKEAGVKKISHRGVFPGIAFCILVLFSCATKPYVQNEEKIFDLVRAINNGEAAAKGLAEAPFLFDGEIIYLQNHLTVLWRNLYAAGFRMYDAKIVRNEFLKEDSWLEFGNTMDVSAFFKKYTDKNTSLVEIKARNGNYIFLLNKEAGGLPRIQGFKGGLLIK